MSSAKAYAHAHYETFVNQLSDWLRIPSISTDPAFAPQVQAAAQWLADNMRDIGFENVAIIATGGHPLVYGDWLHAGDDAPTILVYGHYDVQPALMVDGWTGEPFEPRIDEDRIYARGATDDKGQVMIQLKAFEALLATNTCPVNVKFIIEGEEEASSEHLPAFVAAHAEMLKADICMISDTPITSLEQPSIYYSLRGIVAMEIEVSGPKQDLHSGMGGMIHNPAQAIAEIVAQLHDADGRVAVPGFYDAVRDLTDDERRLLARSTHYDAGWQAMMGDLPEWGEAGYSKHEKTGARPTLEVNGIAGGYAGDGFKTVLPASARAKISCRLVADQDPQVIYDLIVDYVTRITPPTVNVSFKSYGMGKPALTPLDHPVIQAAVAAYGKQWQAEPLFIRGGGSIPIVADFQHTLQVPVVLLGFGLPDANAHGPDENFSLTMMRKGIDTVIDFVFEVAR